MIRKFAEELAQGGYVEGPNEIWPLDPPNPPSTKEDSTPDPEHGFTPHSGEGHTQTVQGTLDRSFNEFRSSGKDYENVMAKVLGDHVKRVSGSSAASQLAVGRFRNRKNK